MTLPIYQNRAVGVPTSERKVVHSQNSSRVECWVGKATDQPQEAVAMAEQPQSTAESLTRTTPDLYADQFQCMPQGSRSARVRQGGSELLGKGLPTVWVEAAEASNDQMEQHGKPTDGQIGEFPRVMTVDVRGSTATRRTDGGTSTAVRHEMDEAVITGSLVKL